jgi:hypothetical protein
MTRRELLRLIAHAELAQGMEKTAGMKGFFAHWTKSQRGEAAKILREYQLIRRKAAKDIADMLEADLVRDTDTTGHFQKAEKNPLAGTPFRPSNGTEGELFRDKYCSLCEKDQVPEGCKIQLRTMAFGIDEPEYPKEWVHNSEGYAICTAFDYAHCR